MSRTHQDYKKLISKYNIPTPRYTSYPTVPYWEKESFEREKWEQSVVSAYRERGSKEGISLYIHLPFCESLCTYCACNTRITVNHTVELLYIQAVVAEWNLYVKLFGNRPIIKQIHLGGGTPTFFSPENLRLLLESILHQASLASDCELSFEAHPANTTEHHLIALYNLGFRRLSLGIQDFDPKVQEVINRKQSFGQVEELTAFARAIGYDSVNYDLIYGLPLQTLSSIKATIQKVVQLMPDRIAFYSYAHVPWLRPGQRKYTELDLPDNDSKRTLYETGRAMLEEAGYYEIGMDHFAVKMDSLYKAAKNNTLHRNFMGYTTCNTSMLIGLGCSSISDTGTAFAQNIKSVEEYQDKVMEGILPVFTGHLLTEEDQIIRRHILNLLCGMHTCWETEELKCRSLFEGLERLKEMEDEGLLIIRDETLTVTDLGKIFIRNICMGLDARYHAKAPTTALFSKAI